MKKHVFISGSALIAILLLAGFVLADSLTIRPNGQGYYSSWTNSGCGSGSSEWQCIDEASVNTSDNLYTSSKSVAESFTFQDTGLTDQTINSVTLYFYGQIYSRTRYQFQPLIRSGSTDYLGGIKSLGSSYGSYSQYYGTNPATGSAWTISEVDALEAGMKSYSANYGGRIAQVYAYVYYTPRYSCYDSDGGNIITVFGNTSGNYNGTYYSSADYCVDSSDVMEYYCSGNYAQSQQESCGSDGYVGSNYCSGGDVYKNYTDYSCSGGVCSSSTSAILQQDCVTGQYCSAGACYWNNTCSDTDGGANYWTSGTVSGYLSNSYYSNSDYCVDSDNVMEYYCSGAYGLNTQHNCGTDIYGLKYCYLGDIYWDYWDYYCDSSKCQYSMTPTMYEDCPNNCTILLNVTTCI
ncbi:MAG: hypothetical protein V1866_07160 [archaeon]